MLLAIKYAAKVLSILNGEISPRQIAAGFALGAWIGLIPFGLLPTILLFLAFLVNVNLAILFLAAAVFKIIGWVIDPIANQVGFALLVKVTALKGFWTALYNTPIIPYTRFNNTIVMGALALGFLLLIPLYFLAKLGIVGYRERYRERIKNSGVMRAFTASTFYQYYEKYRSFRGE